MIATHRPLKAGIWARSAVKVVDGATGTACADILAFLDWSEPDDENFAKEARVTNSPTLGDALMNAMMDAMAPHQVMSKQALNSESIWARMLATLLGPAEPWEQSRGRGFDGERASSPR